MSPRPPSLASLCGISLGDGLLHPYPSSRPTHHSPLSPCPCPRPRPRPCSCPMIHSQDLTYHSRNSQSIHARALHQNPDYRTPAPILRPHGFTFTFTFTLTPLHLSLQSQVCTLVMHSTSTSVEVDHVVVLSLAPVAVCLLSIVYSSAVIPAFTPPLLPYPPTPSLSTFSTLISTSTSTSGRLGRVHV